MPVAATKPGTQTEVERYSFPSPKSRPNRTRTLTQLVDAAETIYSSLMDEKLTPLERSSLARALCDVSKAIRVAKGLPDPGQLRPDSLPLKRAKRGSLIDVDGGFSESPKNSPSRKPNEIREPAKADTILLDSTPEHPLQQVKTPEHSAAPQENHASVAGTPKTKESLSPEGP